MKLAGQQWTTNSRGTRIPAGSLYNRFFLRQISVYVTWLFVRCGIHAHVATMLMTAAGLSGIVACLPHSIYFTILAGVCFFLFDLFDAVDGEIARWTHSSTTRGLYLDQISHVFMDGPSRGVAALHLYLSTSDMRYLFLGIAAITSSMMGRTVREICLRINAESRQAAETKPAPTRLSNPPSANRFSSFFVSLKTVPLLTFPIMKTRLVHIAVIMGLLLNYRGSTSFLIFLSWFYAIYSVAYFLLEVPYYCFVRVVNEPHVKPVQDYKWPI